MPNRRLSTIPEQRAMEETAAETSQEAGKDRTLTFTAIFYLLVIIGIGVPVWIKTTAPIRFSLPDVAALMVHAQMMVHHVPVSVIVPGEFDESGSLQQELSSHWPRRVSADGSMSYTFDWRVRSSNEQESKVIKSSPTMSELDSLLDQAEGNDGEVQIFLVPQSLLGSDRWRAGMSRSLFLSDAEAEDESLAEKIFSAVEYVIEPSTGESHLGQADSAKHTTADPNSMIDPNISVWINFVIEDPLDGTSFQSKRLPEVRLITETVLLSSLSRLLQLKIRSQMVYYAIDGAAIDAIVSKKQSGEARLIDTKHMPSLINSIENRVVETDNTQSFYLNVFVPSSSKSAQPLLFLDETTQDKSNILLTAAKGGFLIWNQDQDFNLGFKLLIRKLIGLEQAMPRLLVRKDQFFSDWELDGVKRSLCQKQILKSLSSLESLEKLLGKVGNIVIGQQVSERMHEAVDMSHRAIDCLGSGRLAQAYEYSCRAFQLSESAFYDPSLLALLYFPDDQKYAVYFPLFLPVSLPLLSSVYHLIRNARRT